MIQFYNTYSRSIEPFRPIDPAGKDVKMYSCGPTVYSYAHIGNLRTFLFEDLLQRHLEARGFQVYRVMNLTDVDDKTIRDSRAAGEPLPKFTARFIRAFHDDVSTLRIKPATAYPAATEPVNIAKMIEMIGELLERDYAYQAEDRSIYFRINRFADYGHLAHLNLEELRPSGRVRSDEYEKESIGDFALWKAWDEEDGDVGWESPWGRGRPGWHIECSAMATCTGQQFVRYWLHSAHLLVEGQKMSKSLGNFYTLRDLLNKGFTGREVRYALIRVNYRLQLNFTFDGMNEARQSLLRIDEWIGRLRELAGNSQADQHYEPAQSDRFFAALDDDLNISAALAELFEQIRATNRAMDNEKLAAGEASALLRWWEEINQVLQLQSEEENVSAEVLALREKRAAARAAKDWSSSDAIRKQIEDLGWIVKDTKDGQKLTKKVP
jgi:cysteinyl-tRNA synthetase